MKKILFLLFLLTPIYTFSQEDIVLELTTRLEESNSVIEEQIEEIDKLESEKQALILRLKETNAKLEETETKVNELLETYRKEDLFQIGIGISSPLGISTLISFNVPKIPIGIYNSNSIELNNQTFSIGVFYSF
jgi:hypothetical protein